MATGFGVTRGVEIGGRNGGNEDLVRAWEEELVRIENVARRSSASIWSFFKFGRNSNRHERTRGRGVTAGAG